METEGTKLQRKFVYVLWIFVLIYTIILVISYQNDISKYGWNVIFRDWWSTHSMLSRIAGLLALIVTSVSITIYVKKKVQKEVTKPVEPLSKEIEPTIVSSSESTAGAIITEGGYPPHGYDLIFTNERLIIVDAGQIFIGGMHAKKFDEKSKQYQNLNPEQILSNFNCKSIYYREIENVVLQKERYASMISIKTSSTKNQYFLKNEQYQQAEELYKKFLYRGGSSGDLTETKKEGMIQSISKITPLGAIFESEALKHNGSAKGFFNHKLTFTYHDYPITLSNHLRSKNSPPYTRVVAKVQNPGSQHLKVYSETFVSEIGKKLGEQDIQIGREEFDYQFMMKGKDESFVRNLLTSNIQDKLLALRSYKPVVKLKKRKLIVEVPTVLGNEGEYDLIIDTALVLIDRLIATR